MNIKVNSNSIVVDNDVTVATLNNYVKIATKGVAIAINGVVIKRTLWETTKINEGDNIVVIAAACGG